jgi:hypothetical protein
LESPAATSILTRVINHHEDAHAPAGVQVMIDVDPMNIV